MARNLPLILLTSIETPMDTLLRRWGKSGKALTGPWGSVDGPSLAKAQSGFPGDFLFVESGAAQS